MAKIRKRRRTRYFDERNYSDEEYRKDRRAARARDRSLAIAGYTVGGGTLAAGGGIAYGAIKLGRASKRVADTAEKTGESLRHASGAVIRASGTVSDAAKGVKGAVKGAADSISGSARGAADSIAKSVGGTTGAITNAVVAARRTARNAINAPGKAVRGAGQKIKSLAREALKRVRRKNLSARRSRRVRYFDEAPMQQSRRLRPGIYVGDRSVGGLKYNHRYLTVIPKNEDKLREDLRGNVREVGPNGERGFVISANVESNPLNAIFGGAKMTTGANLNERDLNALKERQNREFHRLRRVRESQVEDYGARLYDRAQALGVKKYPGFLPNMLGRSKNSNTAVNTILRQEGFRPKALKDSPGSQLSFRRRFRKLYQFEGPEDRVYVSPDGHPVQAVRRRPTLAEQPFPNWQESTAAQLAKYGPYARSAMAGATTGAVVGGIPGAVIGAAAGAATQKPVSDIVERENAKRRPLNAMIVGSSIPLVAAGAGALFKRIKAKRALRLATGLSSRSKRKVHHFANLTQPKNTKGEFIGWDDRVFGKSKLMMSNPNYNPDAAPGTPNSMRLIDDPRSPVEIPEVRRGVYRAARKTQTGVRRGAALARDLGDVATGRERRRDASGRRMKREWEKAYFRNLIGTAIASAGILYTGKLYREGALPGASLLSQKVRTTVDRIGNTVTGARQNALQIASQYMGAELPDMIYFDSTDTMVSVRDPNGRQVFRVDDVRGNSARIYQGDKPKRDRREKRWHEVLDNQKMLWKIGAGAGLIGLPYLGAKYKDILSTGRNLRLIKAAQNTGAAKAVTGATRGIVEAGKDVAAYVTRGKAGDEILKNIRRGTNVGNGLTAAGVLGLN